MEKILTNVAGASNIGLSGFDTVAFFTEGKPVNGNVAIQATHEGASYLFASEENKNLFEADPVKYLPQYGGFCAFGVSAGALFPVDIISTWKVIEDKLYIIVNSTLAKMFYDDFENKNQMAIDNWPGLVNENGK